MGVWAYIFLALITIFVDGLFSSEVAVDEEKAWRRIAMIVALFFRALWVLWIVKIAALI